MQGLVSFSSSLFFRFPFWGVGEAGGTLGRGGLWGTLGEIEEGCRGLFGIFVGGVFRKDGGHPFRSEFLQFGAQFAHCPSQSVLLLVQRSQFCFLDLLAKFFWERFGQLKCMLVKEACRFRKPFQHAVSASPKKLCLVAFVFACL